MSILENIVAEELNLDKFDSKIMIDKLSKLGIEDNVIYFYYKDEKITNREYINPVRPKPKHSEETKRKIGKANKERWREKREEKSNDHTSNKD